jgi:hypothetical protein
VPADPAPPDLAPDAPAAAAPSHPAAHAHSAGNTHCLNCGAKLAGPFCHECGQHDFDVHRSFGHAFQDALENLFHFEGKFFRNVVTLLFRPGQLSADFNAGKRAAQMPPFRLYLFVSFAFFLVAFFGRDPGQGLKLRPQTGAPVQLTSNGHPVSLQDTVEEVAKELSDESKPGRNVDKVRTAVDRVAQRAETQAQAKENAGPEKPGAPPSDLERWLNERGARATDPAAQREMARSFLAFLPKLLLFCLPVFALITRLLWWRSGQVYLQHLVIALHFHTFIYLWVLFRDGWTFLAQLTDLGFHRWVALACNLWLVVHPFLMLRRIFGQPWKLTVFKTLVVLLAYLLTLGIGFLIVGFLVVFVF